MPDGPLTMGERSLTRPPSVRLALPGWRSWFLSGWAVLWGAVAGGVEPGTPGFLPRLLLALAVGQALLGMTWAGWLSLAARRAGADAPRLLLLPYTRPGSPAYRLSRWLARELGLQGAQSLRELVPALLAAVLLSASLAAAAWWLGPASGLVAVMAAASAPLLAGLPGGWGQGAVSVGWPWLLGFTGFAQEPSLGAGGILAGLVAAAVTALAASRHGRLPSMAAAALLVGLTPLEQPLASGGMAFVFLTVVLFSRRSPPGLPGGLHAGLLAAALLLAGLAMGRA